LQAHISACAWFTLAPLARLIIFVKATPPTDTADAILDDPLDAPCLWPKARITPRFEPAPSDHVVLAVTVFVPVDVVKSAAFPLTNELLMG
jgi:hypothetical protein